MWLHKSCLDWKTYAHFRSKASSGSSPVPLSSVSEASGSGGQIGEMNPIGATTSATVRSIYSPENLHSPLGNGSVAIAGFNRISPPTPLKNERPSNLGSVIGVNPTLASNNNKTQKKTRFSVLKRFYCFRFHRPWKDKKRLNSSWCRSKTRVCGQTSSKFILCVFPFLELLSMSWLQTKKNFAFLFWQRWPTRYIRRILWRYLEIRWSSLWW